MGINNRLYDRGHEGYDKSIGSKLLYVDGLLPGYIQDAVYEGRLQIHNAVGACSVKILSSENLPIGAGVYVDNSNSQVVVAWPAKNVVPTDLVNPGFETGDLTGWTYTTKGGSGTLTTSPTHKDSGTYSAYWEGGKGLGSEGGIECLVVNNAKGLVNPGDTVTARLRVMYNPGGGTPKGSRGQARLQWYDSSDNLLKTSEGFLIKTRTYNGKWTDTVVSDRAVPNSSYVKFAGWVTATGAGHTYFDNASWDIPRFVNTEPMPDIQLSLEIMDAAGRTAVWSGTIREIFEKLYSVGNNYVYRLNSVTGAVEASANMVSAGYVDPVDVVVSPDGLRLYIATNSSNKVVVLNSYTLAVLGSIPCGSSPVAICLSIDGKRAYTANNGTVSILNLVSNTLIKNVLSGSSTPAIKTNPVNGDVYVLDVVSSSIKVLDYEGNTKTSVLANNQNGVGVSANGLYFFGVGYNGITSYDATTYAVLGTTGIRGGFGPKDVVVSPDNTLAYIADYNYTDAKVVDITNPSAMVVINSISGIGLMDRVAINKSGTRVYFSVNSGGKVVDTDTNTIIGSMAGGGKGLTVGLVPAST